jgi:glycosyltransferase involved in cell wall biosynthesis
MERLRDLLTDAHVRFWCYPYQQSSDSRTRFFRHRQLGVIPLVLSEGRSAQVLDASHFHLEYPNPILLPLWIALKGFLRVRWIKIIHDGSLPARYEKFSSLDKFLFKLAIRNIDEFVAVQEELRHWLRATVGVSQNVTTIPSLLPIPLEGKNQLLSPELKQALSRYLSTTKRVCSIGAFIHEYGFMHVAEAVESIRNETGEDIGLLLLDGNFARDDKYRDLVLRDRDWITALAEIPNAQVFAILKQSDLFVRAFSQESYGLSRVEAIWSGVPVVATNVGETRGMLTYEFGDIESLKQQIRRGLFEADAAELQRFAALFQTEAEQNLKALNDLLDLV